MNYVIQGRATANEIAYAPAQDLVNRIEESLPEIQRRVVAQPRVELHHQVGHFANPLAAFVQTILDSSMQQLPKRGHADHPGDVAVLNRFREMVARQLGQVSDLRAAT